MKTTSLKHQRYRIEIRKKGNEEIFKRRRQNVDSSNPSDVDDDKIAAMSESRELIPYIKTAYRENDNSTFKFANKIVINNLFGRDTSLTIQDLQESQLIDLMIEVFDKGNTEQSIQMGNILMNILGIPDIDLIYYINKGLFDSFYNKLMQPNQPIELIKVCLFGIGNFSSEVESIKELLIREGFFNYMLNVYGLQMISEKIIFNDFVWIASNCLVNIDRATLHKYINNLNILVDFLLEILKPGFPASCFLDSSMEYVLEIMDVLITVPVYCDKFIESKHVQNKLNKLLLNSKYNSLVLKILMRFIENSPIELLANLLLNRKIDNYYFILKNSKKASLKTDVLLLLSNLVLNDKNWLLVISDEPFMEIVFTLALDPQTTDSILNEIYFLIGNLIYGLNSNNYKLLLDTPIIDVLLKGFLSYNNKLRSILLEILAVFLHKLYTIDIDSFNEIREEIVNSRFYDKSQSIYNNLESDNDKMKFEEIFNVLINE